MYEFSRRTADVLKANRVLRLVLPSFQSFLDINVRKEVAKDHLVLSCAARLQLSGKEPDDIDCQRLLEDARKIDQKFLKQELRLPVSIAIRYTDIEQFRKKRIQLLLKLSYRTLEQWQKVPRLRDAVATAYSHKQFKNMLMEILDLYARETRALSNSVRTPRLLAGPKASLTKTIYSVMQIIAQDLATELADSAWN